MGDLSTLNGNGLGNVHSACPYCDKKLEKRPQRKKKCPHCGSYIFVRTRPSDHLKVLATEEDAQKIDAEWAKVQSTFVVYKGEEERFAKRKQELSKRFGLEASDYDVQWSLLNEDSMKHASNLDWGLYRNTRLQMAEQLKSENRNRQALNTFIEVSYIDANGPNNRGGISDPNLLKKFPVFDPKSAFQAPVIIAVIKKLTDELGLSISELHNIYLETCQIHYKSLKLPIPPQEAWNKLKAKFE